MESSNQNMEPDLTGTFIRLLAEHERTLMLYALTMVPNPEDASDILQDSKLKMWENFDSFEPGTNFSAWARQVIFYQVLKYRRQPANRAFPLSEETLQSLHNDAIEYADHLDCRAEFLLDCLKNLPGDHREIVTMRYHEDKSVDEIGEQVGRTTAAIYRVLSRIRSNLRECVTRSISEDTSHGA